MTLNVSIFFSHISLENKLTLPPAAVIPFSVDNFMERQRENARRLHFESVLMASRSCQGSCLFSALIVVANEIN